MVRTSKTGMLGSIARTASRRGAASAAGIPVRGDEDRAHGRGLLGAGIVDELRRRLGYGPVLVSGGDADDLDPWPIAVHDAEAPADDVLSGPVARGERLVDDRDPRGLPGIRRSKRPAGDDGDVEGVEVVFVHARRAHPHLFIARRQLEAFGRHRAVLDADPIHRDRRRQSDRLHPWQCPGRFLEPAVEAIGPCGVVACKLRLEGHRQDAIGSEPWTVSELGLESAVEKHRDRQEHQREGNLAGDEDVAAPQAGTPRIGNRLTLQAAHQIHAGGLPGRNQTRRERAERGDRDADDEHALVEGERQLQRHIGRDLELLQHGDHAVANQESGRGAACRDQQALGEQLADEARLARADRHPQRHLARADGPAAREQASEIGAGHEQHDDRERDHHRSGDRQLRARVHSRAEFRAGCKSPVSIRVRICPLEALADQFDFLAGLSHRHAALEAALDGKVAKVSRRQGVGLHAPHSGEHRDGNVIAREDELIGTREAARHDADDRHLGAADTDRASRDSRIAGELVLPGIVIEHDHGAGPGLRGPLRRQWRDRAQVERAARRTGFR